MRASTMSTTYPSATAVRQLQAATLAYGKTVSEVSRVVMAAVVDAQIGGTQYGRLVDSLARLAEELHTVLIECAVLLGEVGP